MKHTRRQFLQLSALAAAGVALAACAPTATPTTAPAEGGETSGGTATTFKGKIELWGQTYTPTTSMEFSEDNPLPHNMIKVLADEYMAKNTEVTLTIIEKPAQVADHEWITTGQAGGTIPHICWTHRFWVDGEVDKGWWVPLDSYFNAPNPYIASGQPGSAVWKEVFYEVPFGATVAVDGHFYTVPLDLVTTFFFYNKNLYEKAGITTPPETWGELLANYQKLADSGTIPVTHLGWYESQIGNMLYAKKEKVVNPDGGIATLQEVACAINRGDYLATNEEYKTWLEFIKKYIPFCAPDWAAADPQSAYKFNNQQIATYEDGSWRFGSLRANPLLEFEWGTFYAPVITAEDSPFATGGKAIPIGGPTAAQWSVSTRAEKEGVLATAVDVLHWYSAPQNGGRMIGELASFLPNLKGADVNPDLKAPLEAISTGLGEAAMFVYPDKIDTENREKMTPIVTDWKLGQISLEDAQAQLAEIMTSYAKAAIEKNGWTC
ncbi:MAG: extracellular solute-binding protein [Chloroflexi bacterium]|nr:extracellular solute-binding protein [Chloroflexota bacterium]